MTDEQMQNNEETHGDENVQSEDDSAQGQSGSSDDDKDAEIALLKEKLAGYESKEMSFKKVKSGAEAAKEKIKDEYEAKLSALEGRLNKAEAQRVAEAKDKLIQALVGNNPELKEKVEAQYKRFADPDDDGDAIKRKVEDAYLLATKQVPNPLYAANRLNVQSAATGGSGKTNFADTEEGKAFGAKIGLSPKKE